MEPYVTAETLAEKTVSWLDLIAKYNDHAMVLNVERSVLLVVDMQDFFLDPDSPTYTCGGQAIIGNIQRIIAAFRAAHRPIIFTRHVHHPDGLDAGIMGWWWKGMCLEGSPESEVNAAIAPHPKDKVIFKHRYSAFYNTDLETILRTQKIEDIVMTGIMTNMCCESTTRDAYYRDYRVFFMADATGSITEEMHLATLLNISYGFAWVTDTENLISQINM